MSATTCRSTAAEREAGASESSASDEPVQDGDDFYCEQALSGRTPVEVVHETDEVLAFHHTRPARPTHIVVVPKRHLPSLVDLGPPPEDGVGAVAIVAPVIDVVRSVAADALATQGAARVITCGDTRIRGTCTSTCAPAIPARLTECRRIRADVRSTRPRR